MSLGFRGWWPDFVALTKILREKGVLPVFAVGNEYAGTSRSPGNYAEAVSIGACDRKGAVADFSSSQRFARKRDPQVPDLVAPGVAVISARPGGGYQEMDGSSMATPHVAGLAALLLEAKPNVTVRKLEQAILASCGRPKGMPATRGGQGIPDAVKALAAL
jgi:subtilisin family serine protease